ncbi:CocE/NonD family hydrolase [Bacteroidota bacterium]
MSNKQISITLLLAILLTVNSVINAQEIAAKYNKSEHRVEMRDGKTLFTAIYTPKDNTKNYPIILFRTPYSCQPYGVENFANIQSWGVPPKFVEEGCIFVTQDVRGRFMSEGEFVDMRPHIVNKKSNQDLDESSDTYDTIEWLIANVKNHNGKVGMLGNSYPGFYAAMGAIDAHPALKAVAPMAPLADWWKGDDVHHNGAFCLLQNFIFFQYMSPRQGLTQNWPSPQAYASPDAYNFFRELGSLSNANDKFFKGKIPFWNDCAEHEAYDEYWQARNNLQYFNNVTPAVLTIGGWYDSEDNYGHINIYKSIEEKNPGIYNGIVAGPWIHGGWFRTPGDSLGDTYFGAKWSDFYRDNIITPYFEHFLYGKGKLDLPEAYMFDTGAKKWDKFDRWPPANVTPETLYFSDNEKLSFSSPDKNGYDEYVSDPGKPVPYTSFFHDSRLSYSKPYMIEDQRFASSRTDVLVYETEPLTEDITISGPLTAELFVSTTGTDADFVVKLIDVYPDFDDAIYFPAPTDVEWGGYQALVRYEIMRGKFRNDPAKPEPFEPGKVTEVEFGLNSVNHTFKKGHKIMVQIQSSFFPFFDMNPQTFINVFKAKDSDFVKASHKIFRTDKYPSNIKFTQLK